MADVFVSYKREDAAKVRKLVAALRKAGLSTWWDDDIAPSDPWEGTIEKALREAKAVIVCWSPDAVESENVRSEARVAREDGRLIQVFVRPCELPLFFGERQGVDLSSWRGRAGDPRIAKIVEHALTLTGNHLKRGDRSKVRRPRIDHRIYAALAVLFVLTASLSGWWLLRASKPEGPITVAVLPFRALTPSDTNLVDAIWDDTRGAISRNPNLRVLGRQAVEALAKKDLQPADYRKRVGADYLLDGSIQHVGDQVRMKFNLTETKGGSEIWADEIGGKLDDVFAFQQRVAREVEGRVRGRIAPGGGVTAQNITTTGQVYAMYADARALMNKDVPESFQAAIAILKKAVTMDPNYAPAWASLGQAYGSQLSLTRGASTDQHASEALSYIKRALQLAPNLAHAHAALAMVQNFPPELDGELRKAVELDSSDAEAWTWLANSLENQNRLHEALAARNRAIEIEPLLFLTVANKIYTLAFLRDWKGIDTELARVAVAGDPVLLAKAEAVSAIVTNRRGDEVRILLQLRASHPEEASWVDYDIPTGLAKLGFVEEAVMAAHSTQMLFTQDYLGTASSPESIKRAFPKPLDMWTSFDPVIGVWGRELPKEGRLKEYLGYYDAAFKSPDELFALYDSEPGKFLVIAPSLATALRGNGRTDEANKILNHSEQLLATERKNGPATEEQLEFLAYLRGAQGRDNEAVALLNEAVSDGMLPEGIFHARDIAEEPCFARLVNRPDFQQIRQRIFARVQEERRKVPLELLHRAYPVGPTKVAA